MEPKTVVTHITEGANAKTFADNCATLLGYGFSMIGYSAHVIGGHSIYRSAIFSADITPEQYEKVKANLIK